MAERRKGRGRLSAIDMLPPEAEEVVAWAYGELRDRTREQKDIHAEFNEKLAKLGLGPISYSAFNRHSFRLAIMARRHEEVRAITSALTERLDPEDADDLTIMAAETLKTLVYELMEGDGLKPKDALELAQALRAAETAAKMPLQRRREMEATFAAQVDGALKRVGSEKGLDKDTLAAIREGVLGVKS